MKNHQRLLGKIVIKDFCNPFDAALMNVKTLMNVKICRRL